MLSRTAPALILSALASSAHAQLLNELTGPAFTEPWPPALAGAGAFGRSDAGDFDGDGSIDALLLDGPRVVVLIAPDRCFAPVEAHAAVRDACTLAGSQDSIAAVGAIGLEVLAFDSAVGRFDSVALRAGPWVDAARVRAADLDGAGALDLVGLAADGVSVMTLERSSESLAAFVDAASFVALGTVAELVPLEWDGNAGCELALLTTAGVSVHDRAGNVLAHWNGPLNGGSLARVRQSGLASDRLAWIAPGLVAGTQRLMVLSRNGTDEIGDVGALAAYAVVGGDMDLDGDDDLVIARSCTHTLVWLENARSATAPLARSFTSPFSRAGFVPAGPPAEGCSANTGTPVVADFDGDGDLDIAIALESGQQASVLRNASVDEERLRPRAVGASYALGLPAVEGTLTIELEAPLDAPSGVTHLELGVWHQSAPGVEVDSQAVGAQIIPWPSSWPATIEVRIPESVLAFTDLYRVQVAPLTVAFDGTVTARTPPVVTALAIHAVDVLALELELGASPGIAVVASWPEGPEVLPKLIPSSRVTRFRENLPPLTPPQS